MVLSPKEVYCLTEDDNKIIAAIESKIDNVLLACKSRGFRGGIAATFTNTALGEDIFIREEVLKHYRKVGWTVTFCPDQRDGDFWEFSAPGRDEPQSQAYTMFDH